MIMISHRKFLDREERKIKTPPPLPSPFKGGGEKRG